MRNRLTFPSAGMETKYVWDRHNIQNNGIYNWDKHEVIEEFRYYWDKYDIISDKIYYWEKYNVLETKEYRWYRNALTQADSSYVADNYITHIYDYQTETKYLNLSRAFPTTPVLKDKVAVQGYSNVMLFKPDNSYVVYSVSEVKNHIFDANPIHYGFIGFSYSTSSYPQYFFTGNTQMIVDSENYNYLTFTNLYNSTANNAVKPVSLSTTPDTNYIELTMKWAVGELENIRVNPKTTELTEKGHYYAGSSFYKILNDGFWLTDENAVGATIKGESVEDVYSSSFSAYPLSGIKNGYYYTFADSTTKKLKGSYIEDVSSRSSTAYPQDGVSGDYWYVYKPIGTHYWNKYKTVLEKYTFDKYKYNATTKAKYKCQRFDLDDTGITLTYPIQSYDETTNQYEITGYNSITTGELCDTSWASGGINIQFWIVLDNTYSSTIIAGSDSIIPVSFIPYYTESLVDYNNAVGEYANQLYNKSMLDYTSCIGMGYNDEYDGKTYYYLFTPSTVWGRETGTGNIELNDVIPLFFEGDVSTPSFPTKTSIGLGWQQGNTSTTNNKGLFIEYISTIKRTDEIYIDYTNYIEELEITPDNSLFNNLAGYFNFPGDMAAARLTYRDYQNEYYYVIDACYYNAEIGDFVERVDTTTNLALNNLEYIPAPYLNSYYYYILFSEEYGQGEQLIEQVSSKDINTYPMDGLIEGDNSAYYVYSHFIEDTATIQKGDFLYQVVSYEPHTYPSNGVQGDYWYIYTHKNDLTRAGDYIESFYTEKINDYPHDGKQGDYWYIYKGFEDNGPYKSRWVDEVETNNPDSYPQDGIQDSYWYVFKKEYEGYKVQINDPEIRGGVNYKHNINPDKDFVIGCVSSAEIEFNYDNSKDDFEKYLDCDYCDYYTWQPKDKDWRLLGRFWIDEAKYERNTVKVKAFDSILSADVYVDEFIENTEFPITLNDFFLSLCQFLGVVGIVNPNVANLTKEFKDNFQAINITARQLFQYIAEAAGGFIKANIDGSIYLTNYSSTGSVLDNSQYTLYSRQRYQVEPISGLTVKMNTDDLGVSSGDAETNPYIIENNPLFYADSNEEISPVVDELYSHIGDKVYRPATIELLQDFDINTGDIIEINGDTFYVMSKELSASGCKLECFGNQYREKKASSINSDIVALRGKTNELFRDLESTKSTLTDTANGLQSQITQTATEINTRITDEVNGLESTITQTSTEISTRITNEVEGLESKITQTADSLTSTITDEVNEAKTEIKQTTDSISLEVQNQGDLVAQLRLDLDGIALRGYVTFTDLAGSGTTTINGDNITTGTINADRINMTGAISWGDLDSNCKNTIASFAGADGSDAEVPDYIKSTYIDATRIVSPTIQGGTLSAGTSTEGYMRMSSSGLNFVSNTSGNLMGIGFYPGKYNYPYIIFGDGVDSQGTDRGMIKKFTEGIWIGDSDGQTSDMASGTGIFISFTQNKIYKYINGTATQL